MNVIPLFKELYVYGIMCFEGCGGGINSAFQECFNNWKEKNPNIPQDAQLNLYTQPAGADGEHLLSISILTSYDTPIIFSEEEKKTFLNSVIQELAADYEKIELSEHPRAISKTSYKGNWINILINVGAILGVTLLYSILPPSIILTTALTFISFFTTAFTARHYLLDVLRHHQRAGTMSISVSIGWLLSLLHTLYHVLAMPLTIGFFMLGMNFIMPIALIGIINGMDELKRLIHKKMQSMHLRKIEDLCPRLAKQYAVFELTPEETLASLNSASDRNKKILKQIMLKPLQEQNRENLRSGTIIKVNSGETVPVDGILLSENAGFDTTIQNGKGWTLKQTNDLILAGYTNLHNQPIYLHATSDAFHSNLNKLLLRATRAISSQQQVEKTQSANKFIRFYLSLVALGAIAALIIPALAGTYIFLETFMGIVFSICPCTITIAHALADLIKNAEYFNQGIIVRNEERTFHLANTQCFIFDKTGTLTLEESKVHLDPEKEIPAKLWEKIYLLEKYFKENASGHPIANALIKHYEQRFRSPLFKEVLNFEMDNKNRGVLGTVQGHTIHIGALDFLQRANITNLPNEENLSDKIKVKLAQGFTPIYIAQNYSYQGKLLIQNPLRPGLLEQLRKLKGLGKKLILLTGDTKTAANFLGKEKDLFNEIYAEQTPEKKEEYLKHLTEVELERIHEPNYKPLTGFSFFGDNLNDAKVAKLLTQLGGFSFSMESHNKSAFFSDISLNGTLDYLFVKDSLAGFIKKITRQNQWLITLSALLPLAFIITFSILGIAVSPLIPMGSMVATTGFVLLNSYRAKLATQLALNTTQSWVKKCLASDFSIFAMTSSSILLTTSLLLTALTTGAFSLPTLAFSSIALSISSVGLIFAAVSFASFIILNLINLVIDSKPKPINPENTLSPAKPPVTEMERPVRHPTAKPSLIKLDQNHKRGRNEDTKEQEFNVSSISAFKI